MDTNLGTSPMGSASENVERLLYASVCCVNGPVFEEMQRIRDHALVRNVADQVHVALLYQAGWFMEWIEGPAEGVQALMRRVARDPRHQNLGVVHKSRGQRRLTEPWSMAYRQDHEKTSDFARRVITLREKERQQQVLDPASVWRRISMPLSRSDQAAAVDNDGFQRVMVCSARGTESFDLVRWLAQTHRCKVMSQRYAGAQASTRDVATDYVDLGADAGAVARRVIAMARNGLQIGLTQAFLPDYSHLILLLCGSGKHDLELMQAMVAACSRLAHRPVLVGLGGASCDRTGLRQLARAGGLVYLDCDLGGPASSKALWAAAEPALDFTGVPPTR